MNADFAEEKQQMNDAHSAEVESLNHKFNDAEAEHNTYVAKLNADFAARANETEQKHLKELADKEEAHRNELVEIKEANRKSSAANEADHASELKKAYKSVDKKVEQAEKACEKRMKAKVAEIKKEAQAEIRKAEKKAGEKVSLAKEEVKSIKDVGDLFVRCIRYSLGYCVKRGGKKPSWREPLFLQLGDGRRFRLEFACNECQMNLWTLKGQ